MASKAFAEADAVLAEVNRDHGTSYALVGALGGGFQGGAWRIAGPDGGSAVLKWSEARGAWAQVVLAAEAKVAGARLHGYPTPAWVAAGLTARGFAYQVQEFLPGHPARYLTEPLARQVIDVLECCAAGRRPDPGGDPRSGWSHVSFGASLDGATGSSRAVDAEHRRLDRLEVPQG